MENITYEEFQKLSMNEKSLRWALFIASECYEKELAKKEIEEIAAKYKVEIK